MYNPHGILKAYPHKDFKTKLICKCIKYVRKRMKMTEEIVKLNCRLKGDVARKFLEIKREKGLSSNTETIRLMISETRKRVKVDTSEAPAAC
jgi:hypothetical protein